MRDAGTFSGGIILPWACITFSGIPQSKQVVALFRARPLYYSRDFSLEPGFIKLRREREKDGPARAKFCVMNRYIAISTNRFSFGQFKIYKVRVIAVAYIYRRSRNVKFIGLREMLKCKKNGIRAKLLHSRFICLSLGKFSRQKCLEPILQITITFFPHISGTCNLEIEFILRMERIFFRCFF